MKNKQAINQTVDKIIKFYLGQEQNMNEKINAWLNQDEAALNMIMTLFVEFSYNGWSATDPVANYENDETEKLSKEIYDRAMAFFKKGATV
ncbi:hypothetical protein [Bacillus sp. V5-8f]|uniref:hypothetical protein n=1 Tax=Bacillus sp. V5-8f TaxID=2053044 RepID=UPI000C781C9E|nr:hypothetical protein [Bacillus sp. V5-8f]PLT34110.1 hypothetical protein CUU64_07685 [Bacillus sp. V5-8f]